MPNNSRDIKRRIKSVKNIGQITKAMELVSAAKMRKAQTSVLASRPYAVLSSNLLRGLMDKIDASKFPLINRILPEGQKIVAQKVLIILMTSDRGLAGAFNNNVLNKALEIVKQDGAKEYDFITVGKKGADATRRMQQNIIAAFPAKDRNVTILDAKPIAEIAIEGFLGSFSAEGGSASGGKYEKVFVVYADFVSTLVQKPNLLQILPFSSSDGAAAVNFDDKFIFEPNQDRVLSDLIPKIIEFAIFQAMQETAASEHSARMVAMRNANDAARDLIDDLSLSYNQARQSGITRELSEISAAKLAMEN